MVWLWIWNFYLWQDFFYTFTRVNHQLKYKKNPISANRSRFSILLCENNTFVIFTLWRYHFNQWRKLGFSQLKILWIDIFHFFEIAMRWCAPVFIDLRTAISLNVAKWIVAINVHFVQSSHVLWKSVCPRQFSKKAE